MVELFQNNPSRTKTFSLPMLQNSFEQISENCCDHPLLYHLRYFEITLRPKSQCLFSHLYYYSQNRVRHIF